MYCGNLLAINCESIDLGNESFQLQISFLSKDGYIYCLELVSSRNLSILASTINMTEGVWLFFYIFRKIIDLSGKVLDLRDGGVSKVSKWSYQVSDALLENKIISSGYFVSKTCIIIGISSGEIVILRISKDSSILVETVLNSTSTFRNIWNNLAGSHEKATILAVSGIYWAIAI